MTKQFRPKPAPAAVTQSEREASTGLRIVRAEPPPKRKSNAVMQAEFDSRWTPERIAAYHEVERCLSAATSQEREAARIAAEGKLPDQSSINPAKIKAPVLAKQGYVLPKNHGAPPPHLRHIPVQAPGLLKR